MIKVIFLLFFFAFILFIGHRVILDKAGDFLYEKDELKPADVIVVLSGEASERVEYGVKLFREGWARKDRLVLTGGTVVWKYSWSDLMKKHAMSLGIPEKNIILEERAHNTEEEAKFTKELLNKQGYKSLMLVTSPYHSKRAAVIFRKVMEKDIKVISAPVEDSWFVFRDWWLRRHERAVILNEYAKLIWLWVFGIAENP